MLKAASGLGDQSKARLLGVEWEVGLELGLEMWREVVGSRRVHGTTKTLLAIMEDKEDKGTRHRITMDLDG